MVVTIVVVVPVVLVFAMSFFFFFMTAVALHNKLPMVMPGMFVDILVEIFGAVDILLLIFCLRYWTINEVEGIMDITDVRDSSQDNRLRFHGSMDVTSKARMRQYIVVHQFFVNWCGLPHRKVRPILIVRVDNRRMVDTVKAKNLVGNA